MIDGVGPFNCRELAAISLNQGGGVYGSNMEGLCKEQVTGCADRIQRACKDSKYDFDLEFDLDLEGECRNTSFVSTMTGYVSRKMMLS